MELKYLRDYIEYSGFIVNFHQLQSLKKHKNATKVVQKRR